MSLITDGISAQARAVLAYLEAAIDEIKYDRTTAPIVSVKAYYNCRETGFYLSILPFRTTRVRLHVVCYEHRNSVQICLLVWEDDIHHIYGVRAEEIPIFKDKWTYTKAFHYGEVGEAAQYICERMGAFLAAHGQEVEA